MIAQFAGKDEKWPEIMLAVNTSASESTGVSYPGQSIRVYPAVYMIRKPLRPLRKTPRN